MKRNKNFKIFVFNLLLLGIFIFSFSNCGDSLKSRLTRRLNNFRNALPPEIREKFDNGQYQEAGKLLDERIQRIRGYIAQLPNDEVKKKFIRGEYKGIEQYLKNIPEDDLDFNKRFYKIIDYECIPTFNGYQIVDYFKVYFKEKLETLK